MTWVTKKAFHSNGVHLCVKFGLVGRSRNVGAIVATKNIPSYFTVASRHMDPLQGTVQAYHHFSWSSQIAPGPYFTLLTALLLLVLLYSFRRPPSCSFLRF